MACDQRRYRNALSRCRLRRAGMGGPSAGGMRSALVLPAEARMVIIAADRDPNGVGERAARDAAERFLVEGRRVRIALPHRFGDYNDILLCRGAARTEEIHDHVAA